METTSVEPGQRHKHMGNADDPEYDAWLARLQNLFLVQIEGRPIFTTSASGLWEAYLDSFPAHVRQYHTCNACKHFVERFGGLVSFDPEGTQHPLFWHQQYAPAAYVPGVTRLANAVRRAAVTGVFLSSEKTWGEPVTGVWRHLAVVPPADVVHTSRTATAFQAMAEKREDYGNVMRALGEFPRPLVETAVALLKTDTLYRSEKVLGQAEWLLKLHKESENANRRNVVWRAVATAPAGFCHPRSSMIGTLLEDLASGSSADGAAKRFALRVTSKSGITQSYKLDRWD